MNMQWTRSALSDLIRFYEFLESKNSKTAQKILRTLGAAPLRLQQYPRLGEQLEEFHPEEVRRIQVGDYEIRYRIHTDRIEILRVFHGREQR
jgi:plasmid stabilization system protein ParE